MSKKERGSKNALSAVGALKCISGVSLARKLSLVHLLDRSDNFKIKYV